jgi:hypothetical protein
MIGERSEWMLWTMFGLMAFIMAIPLLKALMPLPLPRSRPRIQARHPRSTHEIENQPATMAEAIPHDGRGICGGIWHGERLSKPDASVSLAREMPERRAAITGSANCGERADRACTEARDLVDDQSYIQSRSGFGA